MAKKKARTTSKKKHSVSKARTKPAAAGGKYLGHYGWMPDVPDQRDLVYAAPAAVAAPPPSVDLRPGCPPVYDQGQLGSCTANAIAGAIQYEQIRQKEHSKPGRGRPDPRRHQVREPHRRVPGDRLAVRDRQLRQEAADQGLH
jgi:hypothetical protein